MLRLVGCGSSAYPCHYAPVGSHYGMKLFPRKEGEVPMKNIPVAGVDVSRKFSDMCILSPEDDVFAGLKIYHDLARKTRYPNVVLIM